MLIDVADHQIVGPTIRGRFFTDRCELGVKINVRFVLQNCWADKSGTQILACKPDFMLNTIVILHELAFSCHQ